VAGDWRRLSTGELLNLYASPNIIWVIKSRKIRGVGQVARRREMRNAQDVLVGETEGKRAHGRSRRSERIILKWILEK
jgi:hypothetical protein